MAPEVAIVVLTWNQRDLSLECLDSLAALDYPADRLQIIVVDNGSADGTAQAIGEHHPAVKLLENAENLGYAGGNDVGIRYALEQEAEYILILNNDVLLAPDTLSKLIEVAEQEPLAGFLGPKVYHRENPQCLQCAGILLDRFYRSRHRGFDQLDIGQFGVVEEVDAIVGCAMLVSQQVIEKIGLLDTRYFMYREEIDWCCRARANGFRILYVPDAKVWHRNAQVRAEDLARITYYMTRNTYLLLSKQHAKLSVFMLVTLQNLVWLLNWTLNPKWRHKREQRDALFKALVDAFRGNYGRQACRYGL